LAVDGFGVVEDADEDVDGEDDGGVPESGEEGVLVDLVLDVVLRHFVHIPRLVEAVVLLRVQLGPALRREDLVHGAELPEHPAGVVVAPVHPQDHRLHLRHLHDLVQLQVVQQLQRVSIPQILLLHKLAQIEKVVRLVDVLHDVVLCLLQNQHALIVQREKALLHIRNEVVEETHDEDGVGGTCEEVLLDGDVLHLLLHRVQELLRMVEREGRQQLLRNVHFRLDIVVAFLVAEEVGVLDLVVVEGFLLFELHEQVEADVNGIILQPERQEIYAELRLVLVEHLYRLAELLLDDEQLDGVFVLEVLIVLVDELHEHLVGEGVLLVASLDHDPDEVE